VAIIAAWLVCRRSGLSGALLIPYLVWVAFASILNHAIWRLKGRVRVHPVNNPPERPGA